MRSYRFLLVSLALIALSFHATAQTPDSARKFFKQAQKKFAQGDFASASEDYSRAIEISSRLDSSKREETVTLKSRNQLDADDAADNIRVIDPFTAKAYAGRG